MIKSFEDFQAIGKDGFDAYVASATAMTKGFQAIAAEAADEQDGRALCRRREGSLQALRIQALEFRLQAGRLIPACGKVSN
jgi:hypothetical protein